ncbi:MAG: hypothetical protein IPG96_19460 [Proteobacteria bacterium]|nr:hypothetical protein [Pseudomonadota bacterium]
MSEREQLSCYRSPRGTVALAWPGDLDALLAEWHALREVMCRTLPAAFTRDEWAYLVAFAERDQLEGVLVRAFGERVADAGAPDWVVRPRGRVAVWLPNNVSLLGPLLVILLSLTGNEVALKSGSSADDLTAAFLAFARQHAVAGGALGAALERIGQHAFDHDDPRQAVLAAGARVRIVFGTSAAADAVHGLAHPTESSGFSFVERHSEAWIEVGAGNATTVDTLIKVFAIYGQAGCTSPRRVVLLDGEVEQAHALRARLAERWRQVVRRDLPVHLASANVMARQLAAARGWDAVLVERHAAVLAVGGAELAPIEEPMTLLLSWAKLEQAVARLPAHTQTVGYALAEGQRRPRWLPALYRSPVRRVVPLGQMHHFGAVWDGAEYWSSCFEWLEVR